MTPHFAITFGLYAAIGLGAALAIFGRLQIRTFLANHSSIGDVSEFEEFKRIVKIDMYLALGILGMAVLTVIIAASGLSLAALAWTDLGWLLFILGPVCALAGAYLTSAEHRMKTLPLNDDSLRAEFDHVVETWNSSAFPDW